MKTIIAIAVLLLTGAGITAQNKTRTPGAKPPEEAKPVQPKSAAAETLSERIEIYASFSQGKKLVGFSDPRYVADDKTDYLKSEAMSANLDFTVKVPYAIRAGANDSALQELFHGTEYLRIGGQFTGWTVLNGQSVSIPKTAAPINGEAVNANLNAATRPGLGLHFGLGKRDFEVDLGIAVSLAFENEGYRTRRIIDANGNPVLDATGNVATEQVPGRGLFVANAFALPTFRLMWGAPGNLQFFVTAGRELFEFQRDYLQSYFRLPIASFFRLDLGVGFFPNATLFVQPNIILGSLTLGVRGGMTLNYYESELRRVSIPDALYFGASLSARF